MCAVNYAIGRVPTTRDPRSDRSERSPSNQDPVSSLTIALNIAALKMLPQTTAALLPKRHPKNIRVPGMPFGRFSVRTASQAVLAVKPTTT